MRPQIDHLLAHVAAEVVRAEANNPPMHSAHEAYCVLLEEVDELWDWVRVRDDARSHEAMMKECIQIAAMALRFVRDVCQ